MQNILNQFTKSKIFGHALLACFAFLLLLANGGAAHAGILAERTRLIFQDGAAERSLFLSNTNDYPIIVQSWVDNGEGNREPDTIKSSMLVLPGVFRLQANEIKSICVLYTGDSLPQDRESVFWLNLYEIPLLPQRKKTNDEARIMLGINTQMKVFYHPSGLANPSEEIGKTLTFTMRQENGEWVLVCHNSGPYFTSFAGLTVDANGQRMTVRQLPDMMAPPMAERSYPLSVAPSSGFAGGKVEYVLINDLGNFQEGSTSLGQ